MTNIGSKYGDWTIIDVAPDRIDSSGKHHKRYLCRCRCGTVIEKDYYKLLHGAKMCKECYLKIANLNSIPFEHKINRYDLSGEYGVGFFDDGEEFYFDKEDFELICNYRWYKTKGYIKSTDNSSGASIAMHRLVLKNLSESDVVDHINRNPLDNRKQNLRICSQADNAKNRGTYKNNCSGHAGVFFDKKSNKWIAYINCDKKRRRLGSYESIEDAIRVREEAEKNYFKEYAPK